MISHYSAGRAIFFRGQVPFAHDAQVLRDTYASLTIDQQRTADGWFDARDDQRLVFMGASPISTYALDTERVCQPLPVRPAKRGMSKAFRRKGRDAITIRVNGAGTYIVWRGVPTYIDMLTADDKAAVINNIFEAAQSISK